MSVRRGLQVLRTQSILSGLPVRGGGGAPYPGSHYQAAQKPLDPIKDDLIWDDGTMNKESVLDIYAAEHITLGRAAAYFFAGCSVFYGLWQVVRLEDKASQQPYAPREIAPLE